MKSLSIIGGDSRIVQLAILYAKEGTNITTYGLENAEKLKQCNYITFVQTISDAVQASNTIIAPIPFSKDGNKINTAFSKSDILIDDVLIYLKGKTLIAGAIPKQVKEKLKEQNINFVDVMEIEELTVLNTIATAEGAIQIAMENTEKVIHGSNVLILGFGRVGKTVANKFYKLDADVTCAARSIDAMAWAEAYGYSFTNINNLAENLNKYDIIINTVPTLILTEERLNHVKKDCLIIDLASKPGGVDTDATQKLSINFEWALGLPGKVAPVTVAEHIKQTIDKIIK